MAEGKKGFILYADQKEIFEQLSDVKAGKLIKHIFKYVNDENPKTNDPFLSLAFTPIKTQLKRDLKHWESIKEKRSKAGKASAQARKKKQHNSTNPTHVKSVEHNSTNPTVIDKDNVKVKVNDIVKVNESDINSARSFTILEKFKDHVFKEAKELHIEDSITIKFLEHWTERDFDSGLFAWQVPETFIIRSRLKGWVKNEDKEKQINYDIK